jgi:hypothetical protein
MDYAAIAKEAGCLDTATEDVTRRLEARFQGETPTPQAVQQWLTTTLREAAPHLWPEAQTVWGALGMTREVFDKMPSSWKLEQGHLQQPPVTTAHPNRPVYRNLTPAELEELAATGLTGPARTEWARARQQTPLPS